MKFLASLLLSILISININAQENFTSEPQRAMFITSDVENFWKAFDKIGLDKNPFENYLNEGSKGLKDFIPYRIESAKKLYKVVQKRKQDYKNVRLQTKNLSHLEDSIKNYYQKFKDQYPEAIFPPVYFVIGAFNAGGGVSENGIIIGTEVAKDDFQSIIYFVIHELIHFNQKYTQNPIGKATLLEKSIVEGSADFIASLIMNKKYTNEYAEQHLEELCSEFVQLMGKKQYYGWLYGSKGKKKKDRPNDLGYWMGYKITEAYYQKTIDKKQAIYAILHIDSFEDFLTQSGYLGKWRN